MAELTWVSGELLELRALAPGGQAVSFRAIVECRGAGRAAFALPGHPYRRLLLSAGRALQWEHSFMGGKPHGSRDSDWLVKSADAGSRVSIASVSRRGPSYLAPALDDASGWAGALGKECPLCVQDAEMFWDVIRHPQAAAVQEDCPGALAPEKSCETNDELRHFMADGYLVVRDLVPRDVWTTAKSFINGRLGTLAAAAAQQQSVAPAAAEDTAAASDGEVAVDPAGEANVRHALHKVWGSSSWQLVGLGQCSATARYLERLIGPQCVDPNFGAQVALRFPGIRDDLVAGGAAVRSLVSGTHWHTDGLRQGRKHPFSLLVGVALSDMIGEGQGNLCVWPGSHRFTHEKMRWPDGKIHRERGWESSDGRLPDLGQPVQLKLRAGDVVFAHNALAHCGGPMEGAEIRYMVYLRVKHKDWRQMQEQERFERDLYCDLDGLRGL